ncbi:MAG: hypothetical protein NTY09_04105, partial [bacterium]|nr:hypothetical protein [bacterium]
MKKASLTVIWLAFVALAIIIGCQGNPSSPEILSNPAITPAQEIKISNSHQYPAYFTVDLNKETSEVTVTPCRTPDIYLNLTNLFVKTMNLSIAVVPSESDPANGLFALDFTLTHPIPLHQEFTAFDVKGIVLCPGTLDADTVVFSDVDETRLENADGYTRWWNSIEFTQPGVFGYTDGLLTNTSAGHLTATVNPYKYFADILGPTDSLGIIPGESLTSGVGRGLFSSGASNTRRYLIRFPLNPDPVITFGYVIDGCWEVPSPNPPGEVPGNFPMDANQPEAYYIVYHDTNNTLYYNPDSGSSGGKLVLQANVYDWQGQAAGNIAGEVASVEFFCPDMWSGPVAGAFLSEVDHKARYAADLTGVANPSHSGEILLAVKITVAGGLEYNQGFGYPAPAEPVAAWQTLVLDIPEKTCEGDANNEFMEAVEIGFGDEVNDTVCLPNDYRDFYFFEVPSGYVLSGDLNLDINIEPTTLGLYGPDLNLITESPVSTGQATIDLSALNLMPDRYYIRIYTTKEDQLGEYSLNLDATVTDIVPHNPVDITQFGMSVMPERIWWNGNYLYMIGNEQFWIYDMTNPSNPQGVFYDLSADYGRIYAHYGNYIYLVSHGAMASDYIIYLLDVSDPYSPVKHEVLSFGYQIGAIAMNSTNLYVADYNNGPVTNYLIYDWSADPLNPVPVGSFVQMEEYIRGLEILWPETSTPVLLSNFNTSLVADDVEDPGAVFFLDKYNCTTLNDVAVYGQYVLCVGTSPLVTGGLFALSFDIVGGFSEEGVYDTSGFAMY